MRTPYRMSWLSMSTLHCWRNRNHASGTAPSARVNDGSTASSASHSARNSRREAAGVRRETRPIKRRAVSRTARARAQPAEVFEAFPRHGQRLGAGARDLVVAARRPLLAPRRLLVLPPRSDVAER